MEPPRPQRQFKRPQQPPLSTPISVSPIPQRPWQFKLPPVQAVQDQPTQQIPLQHVESWRHLGQYDVRDQPTQQISLQSPAREWMQQHSQRRPRGKGLCRWALCATIVMLIVVILFTQGNGMIGAKAADLMRAVLGPTITAQVESWFLGASDTVHQAQYKLGGQQVTAPWAVETSQKASPTMSTPQALAPMALSRIAPIVTPPLAGEGVWVPTDYTSPLHLPRVAKTFLRPDPVRPYAIVTLLQFDIRFIALHLVAGTAEPGGPRGIVGPGKIPAADLQGNALLAAFNGGFKYADGQYGMQVKGTVYVPPQSGAATIAVTKEGHILLGAWGVDPQLRSGNTDLVAWRQNASLLINHGVINSLANDGAAWGGTILNISNTWRSGLGITASGTLLYAAGGSLSALTLGQALHAAGAVMAMQTDINPFWVRAFLYNRDSHGVLNNTRLNPGMQGSGNDYMNGTERDFFYLTRTMPSVPAQKGSLHVH
jgi:hypothetical protein